MSQGDGYLRTIFKRYDELSLESVRRWRSAVEGVRNGTYTSENLVADWMYLSTEYAKAPWSPWLIGVGAPTVEISVPASADTAQGSIGVVMASTVQLTWGPLVQKPPGPKEIPSSHIHAEMIDGGQKLSVKLSGLTALNLPSGVDYEGAVKNELGFVVARVFANVVGG